MKKLPHTEADLLMMLDARPIPPEGPVDLVMEYIKEHDLTPELCQSLHRYQENHQNYGSAASLQSLRQRLYTLLFMDEWDALKPSKCWSEMIRRDFRAMEGERKTHWRRLLKHIRGNAPKRLPASWAREAAKRLAAVGIDDFNQQLAVWFAPFRSDEPLPLSITGSHVLKGLVWYVAVSGDATAKETALWLLNVKWKQKRNMEKAMTALEVLGISNEELLKRNLIAKPKPSAPSPSLENMMESLGWARKVMQTFMNPGNYSPEIAEDLMEDLQSRASSNPMMKKVSETMKAWTSTDVVVDPDENLMIVQGQQHFYRIHLSNGKIERVTDNAELELDWEKVPNDLSKMIRNEPDLPLQCHLLSGFLRYDSIYGKYFRVKKA